MASRRVVIVTAFFVIGTLSRFLASGNSSNTVTLLVTHHTGTKTGISSSGTSPTTDNLTGNNPSDTSNPFSGTSPTTRNPTGSHSSDTDTPSGISPTTDNQQNRCNGTHTGDRCEKKNTEDQQLIIEIASGAGGGVTLFLLVILVCVCVQWRRSEAKVRKFDKKSLKENETLDLRELGGKTNPIYDKDIESNVDETVPSRMGSLERRSPDRRGSLERWSRDRRGSLERRSHDRRGSLERRSSERWDSFERRSPDRRGSLERRPSPYAPSDGSRGYNMESFGKPLDYDRNPERNFIRRDDGRIYHVIDDGEPSNQTLLYQPSRYQQSNGSIGQDHEQPRYTDYPRKHSVYDRIDTSREYKIARPNFGGRSQNYDY